MMATPEKMLKRMGFTGLTAAVLMIVFGVPVIAFPHLISWLVGIYLIVVRVVNLLGYMMSEKASETQERDLKDKLPRQLKFSIG